MSRSLIDRKLGQLANLGWLAGTSGRHTQADLYRDTAPAGGTFDPATMAGAFGDQPGQQERSTGAVWFAPDAGAQPELPPTRLYPHNFTDTGDPALPNGFAASATWDVVSASKRRLLLQRQPTVGLGNTFGVAAALNQNAAVLVMVSPPLDGAQVIDGWFRAIVDAFEQAAIDDVRAQVLVRVLSSSGDIERGTALNFDNGALSNEFNVTTDQSRRFPVGWLNTALTPVAAQDGDRIVVDLGFRVHAATGATPFLRISAAATDHSGDELETTAFQTWVEFSKALKFRGEPDLSYADDGSGQQDRSLEQRWFAPDAQFDGFVPIVAAGFDPAPFAGIFGLPDATTPPAAPWFAPDESDGQPGSMFAEEILTEWVPFFGDDQPQVNARWAFAPDASVESPLPLLSPLTPLAPELLAGLWPDQSAQQDRTTQPVWSDLVTWAGDGFVPIAAGFDPAPMSTLWPEQPGQERSLTPTWFQPDDDYLGIPPFGFTTATVPQQAGLWQDASGQQDRGIDPRWYQPEDDWQASFQAPVPPFDPSVGAAALGFEATVVWQQGFSPDMIEPHFAGPLQSWLMLTWDLTPRGGTVPKVLIDADSGEPFIYLAGPFIVRAD